MKGLILIRLLKIWILYTHVALPMGPSGVVRSKVHNLDFSYSSDASSQKMVTIELVVFKKWKCKIVYEDAQRTKTDTRQKVTRPTRVTLICNKNHSVDTMNPFKFFSVTMFHFV